MNMYLINYRNTLESSGALENDLDRIVKELSRELVDVPNGRIKTVTIKDKHYFRQVFADQKEHYLKKGEDSNLIRALIQKQYYLSMIKEASQELELIRSFRKSLSRRTLDTIYDDLSEARKEKIDPLIIPPSLAIQKWESQSYLSLEEYPENKQYTTLKGDFVRSKSEVFIADELYRHEIPYRYECQLTLKNYGTVYPDFTIFNPKTMKEMYWEHFGMIQDSGYAVNSLQKLMAYESNGIYPGSQLIMTFETLKHPLTPSLIRKIIREYSLGR